MPAAAPVIEPSASLPQLHPYRSLDTSRLKLSGQGQWDMSAWLNGPLWLPFQEPAILQHRGPLDPTAVPSFEHEDRAENLRLALLWDRQGLLRLFEGSPPPASRCRVFNAFKDATRDRQIGDRRLVNGAEMHHQGPSAWLPGGTSFLALEVPKHSHRVVAFISDRKDYYHQAQVTQGRAHSNCLPFAYTGAELAAVGIGECPFQSPRPILAPDRLYTPAFGSLFQGDHLGVEFALESHKQMLQHYSALLPELSLMNREPAPLGGTAQALVIDDFVSVSVLPAGAPSSSAFASDLHCRAQEAYNTEGVPGSPEKDVLGSDSFQAIGAEIDSGPKNRSAGLALCGAPLARRIALASLSLRAAALPVTSASFCARAAGAWVSVCLFRRCTMVVFSEVFRLAQLAEGPSSAQNVQRQSRGLAQELVLASVLAPLCVSDLTAKTLPEVFATDASLGLGAGCSAPVPPDVAKTLWLNADRRGGYSRLDTGAKELLRSVGVAPCEEGSGESPNSSNHVPRQPSFRIDVLLIGRPSPAFASCCQKLGLQLSPALNPTVSEHFDLRSPNFLLWLQTSVRVGIVRALLILPFATDPTLLGRPGRRTTAFKASKLPAAGQLVQSRYAACLRLATTEGIPCLLLARGCFDQPCPPGLDELVAELKVDRWCLDLCQYGWPSRLEHVCFGANLGRSDLHRTCTPSCGCSARRLREPPDPLFGGLSNEVAEAFFKALRLSRVELERPGIESIVVNDLLSAAPWKVDFVVPWKGKSHINTLELGAIGILERQLAKTSPHSRFTVLVDSSVAKAASAKGRSTSLALQPSLRRAMAHQLAFSLYPAFGFAPTRLNIADDPSRHSVLRAPSSCGLYKALPLPVLHNVGRLRLRRPLASWGRLFLVVVGVWLGPSEALLRALAGRFAPLLRSLPATPSIDFDSTLGFPGEGPFATPAGFHDHAISGVLSPFSPHGLVLALLHWSCFGSPWVEPTACVQLPFFCHCRLPSLDFDSTLGFPGEGWGPLFRVFRVVWVFFSHGLATPVPRTPADCERANRRSSLFLVADRIVRPVTRSNRGKLADAFSSWLEAQQGRTLTALLELPFDQVEQIGEALVAYGQFLFRSGQAYYKFSETINAVASLRPAIRRSLSRPWDLAFAWLTEEPSCHHPALPKSILLAIMTVALIWGWPVEAAIFGLTWAGLLRIGETLSALRQDLVLPDDAAPGTRFLLLQIRQPKTRGRAARHQAARVDPVDIVQLVSCFLGPLPSAAKLWPFSDGVLRRRFRTILMRLGLHHRGEVSFELASLRPGGATWMLQQTENVELVRRRGRWLSSRVMEIYLQEIAAVTCVPRLPAEVRTKVEQLAAAFPWALSRAVFFENSKIPRKAWYYLFAGRTTCSSKE